MAFLPGVGTCSYGSHTFNGSLKSRISARFVYDQAERTVAYVVYTLDLTQIIVNSGASTDTPMDSLRNTLSTPGLCLMFTTTGLGTMNVNCSLNSALDVVWGPKPRALEMEPIGSSQAWRVRWMCEVAIPQCSNARYQGFPVAFNYEMTYAIGDEGLTTRTYEGYVEIPMSRWPGWGMKPGDSADRLREQINPPMIEGFKRRPGDFKLSADRRTLNFTIADVQMTPDGLPQFCTNASGSHSIHNRAVTSFSMEGELSASYTVSPNEPKTRAWEMFYLLMVDRFRTPQAMSTNKIVIITNIELTEGLYRDALQMSFKATYWYQTTLEDLLTSSGQWQAIPGTDWTDWATTMQGTLGPRGQALLFYNKADDAILDLCNTRYPTPPANVSTMRTLTSFPPVDDYNPPDPDRSWAHMKTRIKVTQIPGTTSMKTLPTGKLPDPTDHDPPFGGVQVNPEFPGVRQMPIYPGEVPSVTLDDGTQLFFDLDQNDGNQGPVFKPSLPVTQPSIVDQLNAPAQIVQQRTQPIYKANLMGQAIRIGYPIPPPYLRRLNGAKCVLDGPQMFVQEVIGNWRGLPIYAASWNIRYRLVGPASGGIPVPHHPLYLDKKYGGATR